MAIAFVSATSAAHKTAGTAGPTPTATVNIVTGRTYFAFIAFDNLTASTPVVSNMNISAVVAPWAKVTGGEFNSPQAAAAGGVRGELWRLDAITDYTYSTSSPLFNLSASVTAKAIVLLEFTGVGALVSASSNMTGASLSKTLTTGQLFLCANGTENSAVAILSGFTSSANNGSTGGSGVTNVWANASYRISVAGGAESTSSTLTDGGLIVAQFDVGTVAPQSVSGTVAVTTNAIGDAYGGVGNRLSNNFETGIAEGTAITVANSDDGSAGNPLTAVTIPAGAAATDISFTSINPFEGTQAARIVPDTVNSGVEVIRFGNAIPTGTFSARFYIRKDTTGPFSTSIFRVLNTAGGLMAHIRPDALGRWVLQDGNNSAIGATGLTGTADAWYRVEIQVTNGATTATGRISLDVYAGNGMTSVMSRLSTTANTGLLPGVAIEVGRGTNNAAAGPMAIDAMVIDTDIGEAYIGPLGPSTFQAAGTVPVSVGVTGDATRVPITFAVSGTVAVATAASGAATIVVPSVTHQVSGVVPVTTSVVGGKDTLRNQFRNPSVEGGLAYFDTNGGTVSQVSAWASNRTYSIKHESTGLNDSFIKVDGDVGDMRSGMIAGRTYTVMGTIHLDAPQTGDLHARARGINVHIYDGGYIEFNSAQAPNAAGTTDLRLTFTIPPTATAAFVRFYNGNDRTGEYVLWDSMALVEGVYTGPYFDGATGATWEGTPDGSTSLSPGAPVSLRQQVSGTVPITVGATGTVSANLRVSGTAPVVVGTTGTIRAILRTAGIVPVLTTAVGNATRVPITFQVSGTVPVVTTAIGDATVIGGSVQHQVSGTVAVVTTATGDATRVPVTHQVSGTVPVVTALTGTVTKRSPVSGTVPVTVGVTGNATRVPLTLPVSGTVAVAVGVVGDATLIGGAVTHQVSGTVAVQTGVSGGIDRQTLAVSGTVPVTTNATGTITKPGSASGVVPVVTGVSGAVSLRQQVSGTVAVTTNATGTPSSTQGVSGTVNVVTTATGTAFPPGGMQGTVPVTVGVTGTVSQKQSVSGTVAVTTNATGTVTSRQQVTGTVPVTVGVTGAVTIGPRGRVDVVVGVTGTVSQVHQVSGTVAVTTNVVGDATVVGGTVQHQVSGTVAVQTNQTGTIVKRSQVSGTVPVVTTVAGTVSARLRASGTIAVLVTASGTVTMRAWVSGTVVVLTDVTGMIRQPEPPALPPGDITLIPSGPLLSLAGSGVYLTLGGEVDRLPLTGTAGDYPLTKEAERLTLEGTH